MKLSVDSFDRASRFVRTLARPLEQALFSHHFEQPAAEAVLQALAAFCNPDGGFGKALEPDLRCEDSSVLCTTIALQVLHDLDAGPDEPMALGAVRYLMSVYDKKLRAWPIIPAEANRAPRAPWWHHGGQKGATEHDLGNPRPEVLGYLWEYAEESVGVGLRDSLTAAVVGHLDTLGDDIEMHELLCYVRLAEARNLPRATRGKLLGKLTPQVTRLAAGESAAMADYGLRPLDVAPTPESPFARAMTARIEVNLDHDIATQHEDGSWHPNWDWSDRYPEAWSRARREWQGVLTLRRLLALRSYDRIE